MKITKTQLKHIIKEEVRNVMREASDGNAADDWDSVTGMPLTREAIIQCSKDPLSKCAKKWIRWPTVTNKKAMEKQHGASVKDDGAGGLELAGISGS